MTVVQHGNRPLNIPALEALETMTGYVPVSERDQILAAPLSDDLSGLREIAHRMQDVDDWGGIQQPKQEIGEYVESQGFNVPKRYGSFDEAMYVVNQGKTVLMRSEHPQEYDGFSGLLSTFKLNSERIEFQKTAKYHIFPEDPDFAARLIAQGLAFEDVDFQVKEGSLDELPIKRYLSLTAQTTEGFSDNMSYSFWEHIPGKNIMVVADDAMSDRYHITAFGNKMMGGGIYLPDGNEEPGLVRETNVRDPLDPATRAELAATYEAIRQLPRFSARNCPIMEFQVGEDGTIWFLQYHKARPFRPRTEQLNGADYPVEDGWFRAQSVRGALGSFVTLQTALWYTTHPRTASMPAYMPDSPMEQASMDLHYDMGLTEYLSRGRAAYLGQKSYQATYRDMADGRHEFRSRWFKPAGALTIGKVASQELIPDAERKPLMIAVHREYKMGGFMLDYASDGRIGFVRRNPDAMEPVLTAVSSNNLGKY